MKCKKHTEGYMTTVVMERMGVLNGNSVKVSESPVQVNICNNCGDFIDFALNCPLTGVCDLVENCG